MKRFQFKLDVLIELRKRAEDDIKLQLGRKNREILTAREKMQLSVNELYNLQATEKSRRAHVTDAMELRYSVAYRHKLKADILKIGRRVDELSAEAAKIQKDLVNATKDRRAIEIVRERRFREWKKEYDRKEQGFIDDISQQGFIRKVRDRAKLETA